MTHQVAQESESTGRIALVTGAAQGLGRAIATELHANGMAVVLADIQGGPTQEVAGLLADAGGAPAQAVTLDVADPDAVVRAIDRVAEEHGSIDVLVNNAGVTPVRDFFEITREEWERVLAVNLDSAFFACQAAGRHMREGSWGRIINVSSIAGQLGSRLAGAHYSVSKGGLLTLTKVVAKELAPYGVTANAIAPAVVRVPIMDTLPQDRLAELVDAIPVGRIGEPGEVGGLVRFLVSAAAGYITGATFDINGGQYMR